MDQFRFTSWLDWRWSVGVIGKRAGSEHDCRRTTGIEVSLPLGPVLAQCCGGIVDLMFIAVEEPETNLETGFPMVLYGLGTCGIIYCRYHVDNSSSLVDVRRSSGTRCSIFGPV